jgi:hypothetical protein
MLHNDWHGERFPSDRMNLALFFQRGAGIDFTAGPGFTGNEQIVAYPQMWIRDDVLYIAYTQGAALRGIKVARIGPLPRPDRYYLFPRTNRPYTGPPKQQAGHFRFDGCEYIETNELIELGDGPFTLAAKIRTTDRGVLLDTRGDGGGMVWGLTSDDRGGGGLIPFVHMGTGEGNIRSTLQAPVGAWFYCGVSIDGQAGKVVFVIDGRHEEVAIAPTDRPNPGATGYIGRKHFESSSLTGFVGEMKSMAVYNATPFSRDTHSALASLDVDALNVNGIPPELWLTSYRDLDDQPFTYASSTAGVRRMSRNGNVLLGITGDASAGVDLDQNNRGGGDIVELKLRARVEDGSEAVVCTVGDAEWPMRVVVRDDVVWLDTSAESLELGLVDKSAWFDLYLRSGEGVTTARIDNNPEQNSVHGPKATWVYLGDGYPSDESNNAQRLVIDVTSVRSRVSTLTR